MARFGRSYIRSITVQGGHPGLVPFGGNASLTATTSATLTAASLISGSASLTTSDSGSLLAAYLVVSSGAVFGTTALLIAPLRKWTYDVAGTYTWTVPQDVLFVRVQLWGAGGGGGGAQYTAGGNPQGANGQASDVSLAATTVASAPGGGGAASTYTGATASVSGGAGGGVGVGDELRFGGSGGAGDVAAGPGSGGGGAGTTNGSNGSTGEGALGGAGGIGGGRGGQSATFISNGTWMNGQSPNGGGAGAALNISGGRFVGAGGGGGAYAAKTVSVTPGDTYTIIVGAGGVGGYTSAGAPGGNGATGKVVVSLVVALTGSASTSFSTSAALFTALSGTASATFTADAVPTQYLTGSSSAAFTTDASLCQLLSGDALASFSATYREAITDATATATFSSSGNLTPIATAVALSGASSAVFFIAGQPVQGGQLTVGPFTVVVPRGERRAIVLSLHSVTDVDLSFHRVRTEALTFTA